MEMDNMTPAAGNLKISNNVIATVARITALEVEGVGEVSLGSTSVHRLVARSNYAKPVRVTVENGVVSIEISIIVKSGYNIPQLSLRVQQNVKNAIENMTSLSVARVNIVVVGLAAEQKA